MTLSPGKTILFTTLAVALALVGIEGVSSIVVGLRSKPDASSRPVAERLHTIFDEEIGWVGAPNVVLPDMYGPGIAVRTNERGFRTGESGGLPYDERLRRIVCVGDSFTFGYGVRNADSWCALLGSEGASGLEAVNLGLGGFGLDQAYLWYRREASTIPHQMTIVGLVFEDLERMMSNDFLGYGKPVLRIREGRLAVENVPVPRVTIGRRLAPAIAFLRRFRSFELLTSVLRRWNLRARSAADDEAMLTLAAAVMKAIRDESARQGSVPVFVLLPTEEDYRPSFRDGARERLSAESASLGVRFFDLVPRLRALPQAEMATLFIPPGTMGYAYAAGHYTVRGNRFVRDAITDEARDDPALNLLQTDEAGAEPVPVG